LWRLLRPGAQRRQPLPRHPAGPNDGPPCRPEPTGLGPFHRGRHGRQDGIDIAARLEPESGAAVIEKVELDVATATYELLLAFGLGPGLLEIAAHQLRVDIEEGFPYGLGEGEIGTPIA